MNPLALVLAQNPEVQNAVKAAGVSSLGFLGDLAQMESGLHGKSLGDFSGDVERFTTSEGLAGETGTDLSSLSGLIGMLGAPDVTDLGRVAMASAPALAMVLERGGDDLLARLLERMPEGVQPKKLYQTPVSATSASQVRPHGFISAELANLSAKENAQRTQELSKLLVEEFGADRVIPAAGRYSGSDEASFLIDKLTPAEEERLLDLGRQFGQESVLTPRGLIYTTGENAGKFNPLKSKVAQAVDQDAGDNFSVIPVRSFPNDEVVPHKFSYDIDFSTLHDVPTPDAMERVLKSMVGEHYGKSGLDEIDPRFYGTGSAGAEKTRVLQEGGLPRAFYYTPEDMGLPVKKEPTVHGSGYRGELQRVYDAEDDPLQLADSRWALNANDHERLVRDLGAFGIFSGEMADEAANRAGVIRMFESAPVKELDEALQGTQWHGVSGVKLRQPLEAMESEVERLGNQLPHRFLDPDDLDQLRGAALMSLNADGSLADAILRSVDGVGIPGAKLQGGPGFMLDPENVENGVMWASMLNPAASRQWDVAKVARELGDGRVFMAHMNMSPQGSDFANHGSDALIQMLRAKPPSEESVRVIDELLQASPEGQRLGWPGLMSDELPEHALDYGKGELRKAMLRTMDSAKVQNLGDVPSVASIRKAIIEPRLLNEPHGKTGFVIGQADVDAPLRRDMRHDSYDTDMPGEYFGSLRKLLDPEVAFRDDWAKRAAKPTSAGDERTWANIYRTAQGQPLIQVVDNEWLDTISKLITAQP